MSLFDDCNSSDSEDDVDYVPEYDDSDDDEEPLPRNLEESETEKIPNKRNTKKLSSEEDTVKLSDEIKSVDEKKKADDLFKSFLSDCEAEMKAREAETGIASSSTPESNRKSSCTVSPSEVSKNSSVCESPPSSVIMEKEASPGDEKKSVELYEFAGETICVSKIDSSVSVLNEKASESPKVASNQTGIKRKGLASVLGIIEKKQKKLSTLQKSQLDWNSFKHSEGIEEDLKKHNQGKGGFIERQRFLERSDLRSYEIERDIRFSRKLKK